MDVFCQHSCQGEVLASRKDFRMNTCTAHPRGAFMLELVGIPPTETLLPRNQEGEGLGVAGLGRRGPLCLPALVPPPSPGTCCEDVSEGAHPLCPLCL